jgi:transcription elongation factor Elf1
MCKGILMIERPKVINLTEARTIRKVHCGECNWEQEIAAITEAEIKCCPWCGWSDLEISTLKAEGGFQEIECQKHGRVTVLLPSCNIDPLDFMNNLFCPFCE